MNLFVYGTLMDKEIFQIVAGERPSSDQAILHGYIRKQVIGEVYPAIAERPESEVVGILYDNLSETALHRLDRFEGDQYDRCRVKVSLQTGQFADAQVYVFAEKSKQRLSSDNWDYQAFLNGGKELFLKGYSGFRELKQNQKA